MLRLILTIAISGAGLLGAGAARAQGAAGSTEAQPASSLAAGSPPAAGSPAAAASELRRAVALLDYVSGDYGHAVGPKGELLSPDEHHEQLGFIAAAAQEVRADAGAAGEDLALSLDQLGREVAALAPPSRVSPRAREIRDEIAQRFRVVLLPVRPPELAHGKELYAQACAACHGLDGHPRTDLELPTKPPAFAVADELKALNPQRIFSASTYGVPATAMPGYEESYPDAARWDLAFYVLALRHEGQPVQREKGLALARAALVPTGYRELATLSDAELLAQLGRAGIDEKDRELALRALRTGPFAEETPVAAVGLGPVRRDLQGALHLAQAGDRDGARRAVISAYLDHFEPHEPSLRARDASAVQEIERQFTELRAAIDLGDPAAPAARLDALLEQADARRDGGGVVAFLAALTIALREGVEAALIVAALLALLRKGGRVEEARAVHVGWVAALVLGAVTWWSSGLLLTHLSGARRELVEGVLQLATAALLLYGSHWLLVASSTRLIPVMSARALSSGSASQKVVAGLSFAAVYREMFEVVLFFRGLLLESPAAGRFIGLGALAGLLLLAGLVVLWQRIGRKLKPRPLLATSGALFCGLAGMMVGNAVHELQLLGVLKLTVWGGFQLPVLGIYATREGLFAQALVVLVVFGSVALRAQRRGAGKHAAGKKPAQALL